MTPDLGALLLGAVIAGAAGSGHCLAMCGGIAGVLGLSSRAAAERSGRSWSYPLAYNLGRVASYSIAGALAGFAGGAIGVLEDGERVRVVAQWLAAAVMLAIGLQLAVGGRGFAWLERAGLRLWRRIAPLLKPLLPIRTPWHALAAGAVWGWLPCAMAYGMLLVAWLTTSVLAGAAIMAAFGFATLPALVLSGATAMRLGASVAHPRWRRTAGVALVLLACASVLLPLLNPHSGHDHGRMSTLLGCFSVFGY
jgi:sulfite exporter TauE/SafE